MFVEMVQDREVNRGSAAKFPIEALNRNNWGTNRGMVDYSSHSNTISYRPRPSSPPLATSSLVSTPPQHSRSYSHLNERQHHVPNPTPPKPKPARRPPEIPTLALKQPRQVQPGTLSTSSRTATILHIPPRYSILSFLLLLPLLSLVLTRPLVCIVGINIGDINHRTPGNTNILFLPLEHPYHVCIEFELARVTFAKSLTCTSW